MLHNRAGARVTACRDHANKFRAGVKHSMKDAIFPLVPTVGLLVSEALCIFFKFNVQVCAFCILYHSYTTGAGAPVKCPSPLARQMNGVTVLRCSQPIAPDPQSSADSHVSDARSGSGTLATRLYGNTVGVPVYTWYAVCSRCSTRRHDSTIPSASVRPHL